MTKCYAFAYLQDETMDAMSNSMGNIRFVYISELVGTTVTSLSGKAVSETTNR